MPTPSPDCPPGKGHPEAAAVPPRKAHPTSRWEPLRKEAHSRGPRHPHLSHRSEARGDCHKAQLLLNQRALHQSSAGEGGSPAHSPTHPTAHQKLLAFPPYDDVLACCTYLVMMACCPAQPGCARIPFMMPSYASPLCSHPMLPSSLRLGYESLWCKRRSTSSPDAPPHAPPHAPPYAPPGEGERASRVAPHLLPKADSGVPLPQEAPPESRLLRTPGPPSPSLELIPSSARGALSALLLLVSLDAAGTSCLRISTLSRCGVQVHPSQSLLHSQTPIPPSPSLPLFLMPQASCIEPESLSQP